MIHETAMRRSREVPEKWHGSPHDNAKEGRNEGVGYTSTYALGADSNKKD